MAAMSNPVLQERLMASAIVRFEGEDVQSHCRLVSMSMTVVVVFKFTRVSSFADLDCGLGGYTMPHQFEALK